MKNLLQFIIRITLGSKDMIEKDCKAIDFHQYTERPFVSNFMNQYCN